jgi:uncharacterized protein
MSIADELERLQHLYQSGAINSDEYSMAKAKAIYSNNEPTPQRPSDPFFRPPVGINPFADVQKQMRQWAFFLHLSLLAGFLIPIVGFAIPVTIWQMKKDDLSGINDHGKRVANWMFSFCIYLGFVVVMICLLVGTTFSVLVGFPMLIALGIVGVLFPIMGAIKANNGELWKYPLSIGFFKPEHRLVPGGREATQTSSF